MTIYKPKVRAPHPKQIEETQNILRQNNLTTVCEEAACPNRFECYQRKSATFMILGNTCTRSCAFCNVKTGKGEKVDATEPIRLANAIYQLKLKYVVITSVDRDDLKDFGASHFYNCVKAIIAKNPNVKIELLTPDFRYNIDALNLIIQSNVYKLAHNQETVERLSKYIRPQSNYIRSLKVLEYYAKNSNAIIKSSIMLGLGEEEKEIIQTLKDLYNAGATEITIGQYLQPSPKHHKVVKYYPQEYFDKLKDIAYNIGFNAVASGILVRSSYYADKIGDI